VKASIPAAAWVWRFGLRSARIGWRAAQIALVTAARLMRRGTTSLWAARVIAVKVAATFVLIAAAVVIAYGGKRFLSRAAPKDAPTTEQRAASSDVAEAAARPEKPLPPVGRLSVTSDPPRAAVLVDGQRRGFTPLQVENLSPGQHVITLEQAAGSVRHVVKVKANETTTLNAPIFSGWVALFAPFELQVWDGGRAVNVDERQRVMLQAGPHDLLLMNRQLGYRSSRTVTVQPGEVTAISLAAPKTSVTVTATSPAEVWIDGVHVGQTPLVNQPVDIGTRELLCRSATLGERRLTVTATTRPVRVNVDFTKPEA
jgi:hypothetical protein